MEWVFFFWFSLYNFRWMFGIKCDSVWMLIGSNLFYWFRVLVWIMMWFILLDLLCCFIVTREKRLLWPHWLTHSHLFIPNTTLHTRTYLLTPTLTSLHPLAPLHTSLHLFAPTHTSSHLLSPFWTRTHLFAPACTHMMDFFFGWIILFNGLNDLMLQIFLLSANLSGNYS